MPTRRQFDLIVITLLLWSPAKGLAKMWAHRQAATSSGLTGQAAKAAEIIL